MDDHSVHHHGSGGAIYRHVGDEAIITWRLDEARDLTVAVEVIFRLSTRIAGRDRTAFAKRNERRQRTQIHA